MNTAPFVPWYRHPWLWFVIAIPAFSVTLSLCFVYLAVVNRDSVVRDDWYEDGKTINNSFSRDEAALSLGLVANLTLDATTGEVLLRLDAKAPVEAPSIELNFVHSTQSGKDQKLVLQRLMGNEYRGQLNHPLDGVFQIELSTPNWRLAGSRRLPAADGISLQAE
ncbi:MAG: FixH family protein [Pseudomonadota bacterium]